MAAIGFSLPYRKKFDKEPAVLCMKTCDYQRPDHRTVDWFQYLEPNHIPFRLWWTLDDRKLESQLPDPNLCSRHTHVPVTRRGTDSWPLLAGTGNGHGPYKYSDG